MLQKNNAEILALGLMSGTSLDGIDVAFIKSNGRQVERIGKPFHLDYSKGEKEALHKGLAEAKKLGKPTDQNSLINELEVLITERHVVAVQNALALNGFKSTDIDVVGFHGQTILHGPDEGWTWQIGLGEMLAEKLNIKVVNDFRRYDVEHGGQGAPFVPIYHYALINELDIEYPVAVLNIGGVGNFTWINGGSAEDIIAFDTGPGNAMLDDWITSQGDMTYDKDGMISGQGSVDDVIVDEWLKNEYFNIAPPKSLDRNDFDVSAIKSLSIEDGAATLCSFTVRTIQAGEEKCPAAVKNWIVCGGGAHNPTIMKMLNDTLDGNVQPARKLGFDGDYVEAEAFAYLAVRKLYDLPITFPGTTGIKSPSTGGVIHKVA